MTNTTCQHCAQPADFDITVQARQYTFCRRCVQRRRWRNTWLCSSTLLALWSVVLWRCAVLALDPAMAFEWQAARCLPLLLIGLYASSFLMFGVFHALCPDGEHRTARYWATQLAVVQTGTDPD